MSEQPIPLRRALGLRTIVALLLVFGAAAIIGPQLYLTLVVVPATESLRRQTHPVSALFGEATERARSLDALLNELQGIVADTTRLVARLDSFRLRLNQASRPATSREFAGVEEHVRVQLARVDDQASRVETVMLEVAALLELERREEAARRLTTAFSAQNLVEESLAEAQRLALVDLVTREQALGAAVSAARKTALWWLVAGAAITVIAISVLWKRLLRPLGELDRMLARVATGDLNARVASGYDDEMGRLGTQFNEMTRVLRDRAEIQGRFAAAGELIAGVAHEVNNPLMAISAMAETRLGEAGLDPEFRADLQQIVRQSRRAGKLLAGLLRFVRAEGSDVTTVDLNAVIRQALDLQSYQFGVDEIAAELQLDPDLPAVRAAPGRLEQVFVNLISNAIDALRQISPPRRIAVRSWVENGLVRASVIDNGPGIQTAVAPRLFQPFVSTKGTRGTGLGLYISRQILSELGGTLDLAAAVETGTEFVVALPALPFRASTAVAAMEAVPDAATAPSAPAVDAAAANAPRRPLAGLTVLIVDDEDSIRRPVMKYLSRRGASMLEASNGMDALTVLERFPVDVVVADLRMPRMTGLELYAAILSSRPALADRMLFLSGDLQQLADASGVEIPAARVLAKPIELPRLESKILEVREGGT